MHRINEKLRLEEVNIIFKNFSGTKGQYNNEGDRNFSVVINNPELAESLVSEGWNVKPLRTEEGDPPVGHLKVTVSYDKIPPRVIAIKQAGQLQLDEDTCAMLDHMPIKYVDVVINPYNWDVNGQQGVKAYLSTIYAVIDEDDFDIKYGDLPELR